MRGAALAGAVVAVAALIAAPAHAADMQPWDGTNPFNCVLQYAGQGTQFEHPQADPFCVEYDKTHQDISKLGLVKFMTKEPKRTSAAMNKCWYYQVDHWTGQIVAGDGSTETYHWDGTYFFDKRFGWGGVHVEHFSINHHTADPSKLPGFPDSWKPYFGPGRGGVAFRGDVNVERGCLPRPGNGPSPYAHHGSNSGGGGGGSGGSGQPGSYSGGTGSRDRLRPPAGTVCRRLGGAAHSGLGRARLGMTRGRLLRALGHTWRRAHGFLHFCVRGGGDLAVHLSGHGRADFVVTDARSFHAGRAHVRSRLGTARRALRGESLIGRRGHNQALVLAHRSWRLVVGIRRSRVTFLMAARPSLSMKRLGALLIASGR
jgi:uncharacterized membrane protein YgcG